MTSQVNSATTFDRTTCNPCFDHWYLCMSMCPRTHTYVRTRAHIRTYVHVHTYVRTYTSVRHPMHLLRCCLSAVPIIRFCLPVLFLSLASTVTLSRQGELSCHIWDTPGCQRSSACFVLYVFCLHTLHLGVTGSYHSLHQ